MRAAIVYDGLVDNVIAIRDLAMLSREPFASCYPGAQCYDVSGLPVGPGWIRDPSGQWVDPTTVALALALDTTTATAGTSLVATVTVSPAVATGTVQLLADDAPAGDPAPLEEGTALITVTGLAVGEHLLSATFTPALSPYPPLVSPAVALTVQL